MGKKKEARASDSKPSKKKKHAKKASLLEGRACPCCKKHCPLAKPKCSKGKAVRRKLLGE